MAKDQQKSQKAQQLPNMTEDEAREDIESIRWPNGPFCPHCASVDVYKMEGDSIRAGLHACRDCRGHFTVTVGTVMEDSHLPLSTWVRAFHLMATNKKGMSALQLQRNLGIGSYRTAWHLAQRIREAMKCEPKKQSGEVQADETYIGGKPRRQAGHDTPTTKAEKTPIVAMVETDGDVRTTVVERVNANTLHGALQNNVDRNALIVTDESRSYIPIVAGYFAGGHQTVNHSVGEYVNVAGFTTNAAESFFARIKRGHYVVYHHMPRQHLQRYCEEFAFRWNGRKMMDIDRRDLAIKGAEGKRHFLFKASADA